ncbi:TPA: restriction endonuclease subunit S [Vibrio parahaemolyticus]
MVPNGWESVRLSKISEIVTSGSRDWAQYYSDSGSKFIRMTNLPRDGIYLKLDDLKFVNVQSDSSDGKRTSLKEGDLLISITAELGKIGWVPPELGEAYINQHTALVRIRKDCAESKYVAYLLSSHDMNHKINRLNDSGAKAGLNLPTIRSIPMTLPPLPEQRKIAKILSTWDKAIATTEKLIETCKQQKKAVMQQLLTGKRRLINPETGKVFDEVWKKGLLGDLAIIDSGFAFKSSNFTTDKHNTVPIIRMSDFKSGGVDTTGAARVSHETCRGLDKFALALNDFVFGMSGSLSNYGWVKQSDLPCYLNQRVGRIRVKKNAHQMFITYLYLSPQVQQSILDKAAGAAQLNISVSTLRGTKVRYPKLEEQKKIASVLTAANKEIEVLEAKLAHFKQEKKALMQQLLTGKRRVNVDKAEAA